ncbi:hypothetical protein OBBRIDRAFT_789647 [Obba rivulosa]|uniref:Uncharacterized protein n=1 Tax=Obba rivulosa TaxID=1052685 RepID=A0A8E2DR36_9APHY|nr:hypothetical protein OBBRIDRAFT_789647 [Obba rivulosa]
MASPHAQSSGGSSTQSAPATPESAANLRNRFGGGEREGSSGDASSPTSTTVSQMPRSFRVTPLPSSYLTAFSTPARKIVIRADPALVTCFDPSDKELYDLWAPKK